MRRALQALVDFRLLSNRALARNRQAGITTRWRFPVIRNSVAINNRFYEELGDRWYDDNRHPIALLRAETKTRLAYIEQVLGSGTGGRAHP